MDPKVFSYEMLLLVEWPSHTISLFLSLTRAKRQAHVYEQDSNANEDRYVRKKC